MKILQVITSLRIGGAEKLVVDLASLLKRRGHEVDIIIFDGITTPFIKDLQKEAIRVIRFNEGGSMYNPKFIFRLRNLIPKYDIVHAHNTSCQYYVAIAKQFCNCSRTLFVTTEHNTTNRRRNLFGFKTLDCWMYQQYNAIVAISDKATENLQNFIGNRFRIKTIYNGINLQNFFKAQNLKDDAVLQRSPEDYIITMVAGFREQKDQDTLIRTLTLLPENSVLWLIGDGVRRSICEDLAQTLGVKKRVVFAGIRTDVPSILKSSDVIVMSSHWEGLSLSSIEGMSVGKPFIASDVDGLHEIVEGYGILFPHEDAKSLADYILKLMKNPAYASEVANKCFEKASQYDITKTVNAYLHIYEIL